MPVEIQHITSGEHYRDAEFNVRVPTNFSLRRTCGGNYEVDVIYRDLMDGNAEKVMSLKEFASWAVARIN